MVLVVGLGNPGRKYENTKHNMGFAVIDCLVDRHRIPQAGISMRGMYGRGQIAGEKVILLKPMTYMNASGEAVAAFVRYYKLDPATQLVVIYDDVDLDAGQLRIRRRGSAGSHNGMRDIIRHLGTEDFVRIRVGIGRKPEKWDLADYVLSPFPREERAKIDAAIPRAAEAVERILAGDIDGAMGEFNRRDTENGE